MSQENVDEVMMNGMHIHTCETSYLQRHVCGCELRTTSQHRIWRVLMRIETNPKKFW